MRAWTHLGTNTRETLENKTRLCICSCSIKIKCPTHIPFSSNPVWWCWRLLDLLGRASLTWSVERKMRLTDFFGIDLMFFACREPCWSLECRPFQSSWCGDDWPSVRTSVDICDKRRLELAPLPQLPWLIVTWHFTNKSQLLACQLLQPPL